MVGSLVFIALIIELRRWRRRRTLTHDARHKTQDTTILKKNTSWKIQCLSPWCARTSDIVVTFTTSLFVMPTKGCTRTSMSDSRLAPQPNLRRLLLGVRGLAFGVWRLAFVVCASRPVLSRDSVARVRHDYFLCYCTEVQVKSTRSSNTLSRHHEVYTCFSVRSAARERHAYRSPRQGIPR